MAGLGYTPYGAASPNYRSGIRLKRDRALSEFLTPLGQPTPWLAKAQNNFGFAGPLGCGRVDVTLTGAQLALIFATPQTLLPAVAGQTYVIEGPIFARFTYGAPAFTGGGAIQLQYHTGAIAASEPIPSSVIDAAVSSEQILCALPITATNLTPTIGDSIEITNATGAFSAGGGGTLRVTFTYLMY